MKLRVIFLSFLAGISSLLSAQGKFEIHGGVSVPSFEFRQTNTEYGGGAETGVNFGVKYIFPLRSTKGLSFTVGADYLSNGLNQDGKTAIETVMKTELTLMLQPYSYSNFSINHYSYLNIPVLVGFEYKLPIDKSASLFLNGGLGPNYSKPSDFSVQFNSQGINAKIKESFMSQVGLAYQLGIGVLYQNQYSVQLNYNALGLYKNKGKSTFEANGQSQTQDISEALRVNINTFCATFGIRF
jgi:hypothetical protein